MLSAILTALKCDNGDFGGLLAGVGYVIRCPRRFGSSPTIRDSPADIGSFWPEIHGFRDFVGHEYVFLCPRKRGYSWTPDTLSDVHAVSRCSPISTIFPDFGLFWSERHRSGIWFAYELRILTSTEVNQPRPVRRSGNYPELGRTAAARIPRATLIEFPDLGHAPQIQAPAQFQVSLLKGLATIHR